MHLPENPRKNDAHAVNGGYQETRWSLVLKACAGSTEALEDLGRAYWPVVFAFLRRKGLSEEDAQDLTQDTFSRLLKEGQITSVSPEKGRFRSFLYACAEHEASHFWERSSAQKRGANRVFSLEASQAEQHSELLPISEPPTAQAFDRAWSKIIVGRALKKLESEYNRLGKGAVCRALIPLLNRGTERGDFRVIAQQLGLSEGNARVTWSRFKTSFVGYLRSEVEDTVVDLPEVDAELRHLLGAWLSTAD